MGSRDPVKPLRWAGSSRSGGETDPATKALQGFGGRSVLEIVAPYDGDTWRTVYTVRFEDTVYVLHAGLPILNATTRKGRNDHDDQDP